ncbi:MAG: AbrB/MazE/SpoVT family DNA-binding domain-containing protein [Arenicellales bacterium]
MQTEAKLIPIGNSKGIRIPKPMLLKYNLQEQVLLEEVEGGLFIHAKDNEKLSWEDTYKEMSAKQKEGQEEWSDWHAFEDDIHEE